MKLGVFALHTEERLPNNVELGVFVLDTEKTLEKCKTGCICVRHKGKTQIS